VNELRKRSGVAPSTVMLARIDGRLPGAIWCNGGYIWEREALEPYLQLFIRDMRRIGKCEAEWDPELNCPVYSKESTCAAF